MHYLSYLRLFALFLIAANSCVRQASADDSAPEKLRFQRETQDPAKVLRMISEQAKANYSKIHTWSATYRFQDKVYMPQVPDSLKKALAKKSRTDEDAIADALLRIDSGDFDLEVDVAKESFYCRRHITNSVLRDVSSYKVLVHIDTQNDKLPFDDGYFDFLVSINSILTPGHYIHMEPDQVYPRFGIQPKSGPEKGPAAFRDPSQDGAGKHWSVVVDPRRLFGDGAPGWDVAMRFAQGSEKLAKTSANGEKEAETPKPRIIVKRADTNSGPVFWVHIALEVAPKKFAMGDFKFDGRVGFNIIERKSTEPDGQVSSSMNWEYKKYHDVFVPTSIVKMTTRGDTGKLSFQRNLDLEDCAVNGPLDPDGFTYKRLGLKDGERVVDRIKQKVYVLDGDELIPLEGSSQGEKLSKSNSNALLILIGANVLVIGLIGIYYWRKRRNTVRASESANSTHQNPE